MAKLESNSIRCNLASSFRAGAYFDDRMLRKALLLEKGEYAYGDRTSIDLDRTVGRRESSVRHLLSQMWESTDVLSMDDASLVELNSSMKIRAKQGSQKIE